ncbi:PAS domain-containing protein [Piscinibacter sp.]|uniref:hybrid sensor histidine kinase/response regulator n=1 Tax=Piscinibacter sp. TaxID=1903157 RepID=UPI0039E4DDFE
MSDAAQPSPSPQALADWAAASSELLAISDDAGELRWCNDAFRQRFGAGLPAPLRAAPSIPPGERVTIGERCFAVHVHAVPEGLAWRLVDETAQREAERLRELLEVAQQFGRLGLWERDFSTGRGHWDHHVFDFWGLDPAQGTPDFAKATRYIHPEDHFTGTYLRSQQTPGRYSQHYRVLRPDGTVRRIHSQWEVKAGAEGRPTRAIGVMMDDTDIYELARSLTDVNAQLQLAVELAGITIWRHDLRSNRIQYNEHGYATLGIPPQPEGLPIAEVRGLVHPDDLAEVLASTERALASNRPTYMQARYRRSDGVWRHVLARRVAQRAADGTPLAFFGVGLDITEQVEQRRQSAELERHLELAAESAQIGIWWRDAASGEGQWNAQMFAITGRDPSLGTPPLHVWEDTIVHPDDRERIRLALRALTPALVPMQEREFRIVRPDGEVRWLINRARPEDVDGHRVVLGVTIDVTEQRLAQQALRSADERSALIARSVGIGTWEIDFDSGVERWDEQLFHLRGLAPAANPPSTQDQLALVHPDDRARTIDACPGLAASTQPTQYEFRIRLPDGRLRWLASRSLPVADEHGRTRRRIGINWDVTDAREAAAAREATIVAERASQAKSQFLARMSHELRTPLNAVLGFTQLLQFEDTHPSRVAKLGHIRAAGEHLLSLIDGVLDLTRMEAGNLRLQLQAVDLDLLAGQALPLVAALARRHEVQVLREAVEGCALADRTRTLQVLVNLLTNAIKYNRPGGCVRLSARGDGDTVTISVADTGRGLSAAQVEHLFEPFNRLGAEREGIEGVGIGLTIVKALVSGMGGRIAVTSEPGRGSRFDVTLPAAEAGRPFAPASEPAAGVPAPISAPRGRLLYIEDNPVNVMLVEEIVRSLSGLSIHSEATGADGVARAAALRPDLVLIDMQLPDFDGYEVLRRLRAQPETAAIPCVALSANAMPEDIARARAAGFDDYWTKPIDFRGFLGALEARFPAV